VQPHGQTHTTSDLRDPSLRSLAHEGSRHVDDAFVREHQLFVRRCLLRFGIAGADVDDAAQDVFVVALRHTGPFDVQRSARPWLYTVALNVARNLRRKHQRVETPMAEPPEVHVPPPQERSLHAHEARSLVHRALDELPPAQRDVVLLHRLEGWPMELVAETVGCPVATAHSRLRLGSARLDRAVRKHALRARCAALLAAFLGAFASPPAAAAATVAVVLVVVGAVVVTPRSAPPADEEPPSRRPLGTARAGTPASAPTRLEDTRPELPANARQDPLPAEPPSRAVTRPRGAVASVPAAPPVVLPTTPVVVSVPAVPQTAPEPPEDPLVAETRMLARARALVTTSPAGARQALDAYDARFPQGQLHRERAAIEGALARAAQRTP
jgi:RNA polymerase sigma-70 factor (ECF subfamily)